MTDRNAIPSRAAKYRTIVADPPWPQNDEPLGRQRSSGQSATLPYGTMPLEEIAALPVGDMAAPGAHLYLWTTNRYVADAVRVAEAWGFRPATWITWCKEPMGLGGGSEAFANTTEFVLWGRKTFGDAIRRRRLAVGLSQTELARLVLGDSKNRLVQRWEVNDSWPQPGHLAAICEHLEWDASDFAGAPARRWHTTWFQWKRGAHSAKPEAFLDLVEQTSPSPYLELFARRNRLGWDTWGNEALEHVEMPA